ncbi:MAG: hypothetical protein IPL49_06290 [Saprospirales bacterium]|nr:hypothetical protein [Saprospirales bacterium]
MYSFAQRSDTTVVDEPLYAYYLSRQVAQVAHPGETEILKSQSTDAEEVVREMVSGASERPVVFFKQMTHHLVEMDLDFLEKMENVMLIRDHRAMLFSYAKVIPNPTIRDLGIEQQLELVHYLEAIGKLTAVLDAKDLLMNPAHVLTELCRRLGIPFDERMLNWEAGARPEDGVWAKYWYSTVHHSTGFQPYQAPLDALPPHLEDVAEKCQPLYAELYHHAIKAP